MDLHLDGQVAVITGGSRGIGLACARRLGAEGCSVMLAARAREGLDQACATLAAEGISAQSFAVDMRDPDGAEALMKSAFDRFQRLDILVNCAGASPGGALRQITQDQWQLSLELKFMGYIRSARAVLPYFLRNGRGHIVNVVGNDGVKPTWWEITAGAANAAVLNVMASLAEQYAPRGITINCVNPGPVNTQRWEGLVQAMSRDLKISLEEAQERARRSIPVGRIPEPEEIADLVTYLASPLADFLAGSVINVDGSQRKAVIDHGLEPSW